MNKKIFTNIKEEHNFGNHDVYSIIIAPFREYLENREIRIPINNTLDDIGRALIRSLKSSLIEKI